MTTKTSGSGERNARRGLAHQDHAAALLIYQAILERTLSFIALADDDAGMFDDLVIGIADEVIGHQYKSTTRPKPVGVQALLLGKVPAIADCAASFSSLERAFPSRKVRLRFVSSHYAATHDGGRFGVPGRDSADFFEEKRLNAKRSLSKWRTTCWQPLIDELQEKSGLDEKTFERFFSNLEIVLGAPVSLDRNPGLDPVARAQIKALSLAIGDLLVAGDGRTRWTFRELLEALGWPDRIRQRFEHRFPIGAYVQSNELTEAALEKAMIAHTSGYLCLLGPPGTGKSTLLERFVQNAPGRLVMRYLAYVPGAAQGQGRGDAGSFLSDINGQLVQSGLRAQRSHDDTDEQRRETFEILLRQAGERFANAGTQTVIVIDGLDHVPREEKPQASLLAALPLPQSLPDGVLFVLGSQRIDLADIARSVRDQANHRDRRVDMAPLTLAAVTAMLVEAGLGEDINPAEVLEASTGHALFTHYLLGKLGSADAAERRELLGGGFAYDGDLEAVYRKAWREAVETDGNAARVLLTLGYVEGAVEPAALARSLSRQAVDAAYRTAHHLLDHRGAGWQVFHNSFRLFLQRQNVELYGRPDPEFSAAAIYLRLARLAQEAASDELQRWLTFRYYVLAGENGKAAQLASRRYFIDQFVDGRPANVIASDIRDAVACLGPAPRADSLFQLLLARDELWRRQDTMETAEHVVAAQLALGELATAEAQLQTNHTEGDQWLVIAALIENGQPGRARALFDKEAPWALYSQGHFIGGDVFIRRWAQYALMLLDEEQIARRLTMPRGLNGGHSFMDMSPEDYLEDLHAALAMARVERDANCDPAAIASTHGLQTHRYAILHLLAAEARVAVGASEGARQQIEGFLANRERAELHVSWDLRAVKTAIDCDAPGLAALILEQATIPDLCGLDHSSHEVAHAVRQIIDYSALASHLGHKPPQPSHPAEAAFRGIQHHSIELGTAIGTLAANQPVNPATIKAIVLQALAFQAGNIAGMRDDPMLGYRLRFADAPIIDAIGKILKHDPDLVAPIAASFDEYVATPGCAFARSFPAIAWFAVSIFEADGDRAGIIQRLDNYLAMVKDERSPAEAVDALCHLAMAYGRIGMDARGGALLREMRAVSFGTALPAKKDGLYQTWADVLVAANQADPAGATDRSRIMLRFMFGVNDSPGNDQAARIGKTVLVEAVASSATLAADTYVAALTHGFWNWDAIIDGVARGILRRRQDLAVILSIVWRTFALPYYEEEYSSLTAPGAFLSELVSHTPLDKLGIVESIIVTGIEVHAQPADRVRLLGVFRKGLDARGVDFTLTAKAIARWRGDAGMPEPDPFLIDSFETLEAAVAAKHEMRAADRSTHHGNYAGKVLAEQAARLIARKGWAEAEAFVRRHPALLRETVVARAAARSSLEAGDIEFVRSLLLPDLDENEGWGGWGGGRRRDFHQCRHWLGEIDAHDAARHAFLRDVAEGGPATGSAHWQSDKLFPLLFQTPEWPLLWEQLAEQIYASRDYGKSEDLRTILPPLGDDALITRIFVDAARLGVNDPRKQVQSGLLLLLEHGKEQLFCEVCSDLLAGDSTLALIGARLLIAARDNLVVADTFRIALAPLLSSDDAAIFAIGTILAEVWGVDIDIETRELPAIYGLALPALDHARGRSLRDVRSGAPVLDDPVAWTEPFNWLIKPIAAKASFEPDIICHRLTQIIVQWGGAGRYGAGASEALERRLRPLSMLLSYPRPHAVVVLDAMRTVVGELWKADRISPQDVEIVLAKTMGSPVLPPPLPDLPRPVDLSWPVTDENLWQAAAEEWLDAEDFTRTGTCDLVLGEWSRFDIFEHGLLCSEETLIVRGDLAPKAHDLEIALDTLPPLYWHAGTALLLDGEISQFAGLRRLAISGAGDPGSLLSFDPVLAAELGWKRSNAHPCTFSDADGTLMVSTKVWRDGWEQSRQFSDDSRWAHGQRVCFTQQGLDLFRRRFPLPDAVTARWRSFHSRNAAGPAKKQWRSMPAKS